MECVTTNALNSAVKCKRSDVCASAERITTDALYVTGNSKTRESYIPIECVATYARYLAWNIERSDSCSVECVITNGFEFHREYKFFKACGIVERITVDRGHAARKGYTCKRGITVECIGCDTCRSAWNGNCLKSRTIVERIRIQSGKTCSDVSAFKLRAVLECITAYRRYFIIKYDARNITASVECCRRNIRCIRNRYSCKRRGNVVIIRV